MKEDFTRAELERGFEMAQALNASRIATSAPRHETRPGGRKPCQSREVPQLPKRERYPIVADIEYDYRGSRDPEAEIAKMSRLPPPGAQ